MAKFHDLLTRIADEGVVALDGFPVDSWRAIRAMKEVGLLSHSHFYQRTTNHQARTTKFCYTTRIGKTGE